MKVSSLLHATFLSADLVRSRAFYEGLLGLSPDPARPAMSFDGVWYDVADGQQIHLMRLPDPEVDLLRPAHGGRDRHLAVAVDDVTELAQRLAVAGITYTLSQSGRRALFCRDPDGNALEFIEMQA
jgi:catechol 2,3-dioxygenase-like lactoylglutathione lyase family enzyme